MAIVLGIESSCDETAASVCISGQVINNKIASQSIHSNYGGVVPELASRDHHKNIVPIVHEALNDAEINTKDLDAIAYTRGPGLLGSLLVGSSFAKAMAASLSIPIIPVHHMKAHILAHFIDEPKPPFPFICLTVSGGHTQIVKVDSPMDYTMLGQTLDDAVGEAFDKAANLLGLSYPGGAVIDKLAAEGNPHAFQFSTTEMQHLNYSFSGIKTSILHFLRKERKKNKLFIKDNLNDLAASIQRSLIDMLMNKLVKAATSQKINQVAIAGGVSANSELRKRLKVLAQENQWTTYIPNVQYCTDNAGMVSMSGHILYEKEQFGALDENPLPRMSF
ncbi:MAG: tRNA (adenosine(37)-N6)-threonylcarbamoyltransferase complex transferase subunit TsaD [Ekhidna sp.]|nr:tRNA (adenosine(37)-N6)-threonylcarbamoyltransferase complex transferase subunit TsaD [Ekhidna sp.]